MVTSTLTATTPRQGFQTLEDEVQIKRLPVSGAIPPWLAGTLVRVTPAMLDIGGKPLRHWFDGLAMLNAFSFADGRVGYGSRFLRTRAYAKSRDGELGMIGFAQDPCRALFKRTMTLFGADPNDNCNVNVSKLGQRYIAMTEVPLPVEFDAQTLETAGLVKWRDRLGGHIATAHPHFDPGRRELLSYVSHISARTSYRLFAVPEGSTKRQEIARIPVREPAYMHSFAMTERYLVLAEFPFVLDPLRLAVSRRPLIDNYRWKPERGTRFFVVERHTGELQGTYEAEPFFAFHHANAFERDGELLVDVVVHEHGPVAMEALQLERLRAGGDPVRPTPLKRFRVPLGGGDVTSERLSDHDVELPRINYGRCNAREYHYVYAAAFRDAGSDWFDQLVKVDVETGDLNEWSQDGCYPGEPVFVSCPGERAEDDGVVLSVVLDANIGRSFLLVLEATSLEERGRAEVPHHIPFGFHGQYFGDQR
jgi:beta,beta-carotene 9',10'-dioxygenase